MTPDDSQSQTLILHLDLTMQQTALLEALELLHLAARESSHPQVLSLISQSRLRIRYSVLNSLPPDYREEAALRLLRSRYPALFQSVTLTSLQHPRHD